jgi:hypothetical protein
MFATKRLAVAGALGVMTALASPVVAAGILTMEPRSCAEGQRLVYDLSWEPPWPSGGILKLESAPSSNSTTWDLFQSNVDPKGIAMDVPTERVYVMRHCIFLAGCTTESNFLRVPFRKCILT